MLKCDRNRFIERRAITKLLYIAPNVGQKSERNINRLKKQDEARETKRERRSERDEAVIVALHIIYFSCTHKLQRFALFE